MCTFLKTPKYFQGVMLLSLVVIGCKANQRSGSKTSRVELVSYENGTITNRFQVT